MSLAAEGRVSEVGRHLKDRSGGGQVPSLNSSEVSVRARRFLGAAVVVFAGVVVASGCGRSPSEGSPQAAALATGEQVLADTPVVQPEANTETGRDTIMRALDNSLSEASGTLTRHMTVGRAGMDATLVYTLVWDGQTGMATSRLEVDEKYLAIPEVRELLDSLNRDRALDDRELNDEDLQVAFVEVRTSAAEMIDEIEAGGTVMEPIGLGWWEGALAALDHDQKINVLVEDGRVRTAVFTVDVMGTTATDTWEFSA